MPENLLYRVLSSSINEANHISSNKILTPSILTKVISSNIRLIYRTGTENLGNFTILRNLSKNNSYTYATYSNSVETLATTNYTNNSVKIGTIYPKTSATYKTNFSTNTLFSVNSVSLTNTTIILPEAFNSSKIDDIIINFEGTPTDNFTKKVIEEVNSEDENAIHVNAIGNGHVITNAGIKSIADRFETIYFHVRQAGANYGDTITKKSLTAIIGGDNSVGTPTHKSRLYGQTERNAYNDFKFITSTLDLTKHANKYGFTNTDTILSHENSETSYLIKATSGSLKTNDLTNNKGLVFYFDKNKITTNGVLGLIPAESNIIFNETGDEATFITVRVTMDYIFIGSLPSLEYYNTNRDQLYIVGPTGSYVHANYDDTNDHWYSYEQVFTITAPAFKEYDN